MMSSNNPFPLPFQNADRLRLSPRPERRWVAWVLLTVFLLFFFGYLYIAQQPDQATEPFRWVPAVILGLFCLGLLYAALFETTRPNSPLSYSAAKVWRRRLNSMYLSLFINVPILIAILVFTLNDEKLTGMQKSLVLIMALFFILLYSYWVNYLRKKLREAGPFGHSEISIPGGLPASLGQSVNVSLYCEGLPGNAEQFTATLRNVHEYWIDKKKRKSDKANRHKTDFLSEQRQQIAVTGSTAEFTVWIDPTGKPTDYHLNEPVYWELEVRDKTSGYYARFFLDVV